jgi:hypothetical protein
MVITNLRSIPSFGIIIKRYPPGSLSNKYDNKEAKNSFSQNYINGTAPTLKYEYFFSKFRYLSIISLIF